ncbi:hypothetical protein COR50_20370 [Chitinophaga caeni]|uniref:ABC transporter permease n=1 Tax=Chitinophaga caeni TaxID=2029983 RepID=A0A291QZJ8_9BACT|nr:hypothetical protein [Chitinophaga caeni]ATL49341.1 hypothetical protein COR50_20370 [Chitinophaga caeni]
MREGKKYEFSEILSSIDGLSRATPAPYFYTRLRARMEKASLSAWERMAGYLTKPVVVVVFVGSVLALNSWTVLRQVNATLGTAQEQSTIQGIREELNIASNTNIYDLIKPE